MSLDKATVEKLNQKNKPEYKLQQQIKDQTAQMAQLKKDYEAQLQRQQKATLARGPGYVAAGKQTNQEKKAGITAPGYEGTRDVATGELLKQFKFDPYAGEAAQALKEQAFAQGDSPWAKMQLEKLGVEQQGAREAAARAQNTAMAQAQSQLMRQGGLSSGARALMARQGARDAARAQQDIQRQGMLSRLGVQEQDLGRKQDLLQRFGQAEIGAQEANINQLTGDVTRRGLFDIERYKQQMQAYGAEQTAKAQAAAGGGGGKK